MNNAPPLDELWLSDPALGSLLGTLTSGPTTDELASQRAVLAAFRDARDALVQPAQSAGPVGPVRPVRRARRRGRMAVATAIAALVMAAAGYAKVLPPSVQHVADRVLRLAGLGEANQRAPRAVGRQASSPPRGTQSVGTAPAGHGPGNTQPSGQVRPAIPPPPPGATGLTALPLGTGLVAWAAAGPSTTAGAKVLITAWLTDNGRGVPGATLRLHEHAAGKPGWRLLTMAKTRAGGGATLIAGHLTVNASFRVTGPGPHASAQFAVIVIPRVGLRLRPGTGDRPDVLAVRCWYAAPGDHVLLQAWSSPARWSGAAPQASAWRTVRVGRMGKAGHASFMVSSDAAGQIYRVVVEATADHGPATSSLVLVGPRSAYLAP